MKKRSIQAKKDPDIRTFEWYTDKFFQGFVFVAGISGIIFALGIFAVSYTHLTLPTRDLV